MRWNLTREGIKKQADARLQTPQTLRRRSTDFHDLDLTRCFFVGDKARDIIPALALGGRGVLVKSTNTNDDDLAHADSAKQPIVSSLSDAVELLLAVES